MPAHSELSMEPPGIVQLSPMLSKGIFGVHTKPQNRSNQLKMREQQHLASCRGGHVLGQQVRSLTLKLPQTAGIKDQTLKHQGADGARWLLSVIPAGAEPFCVHVRNLLGSGSGWETNMALAPLPGRSLCLPLCKQQVVPIGEAILTLPKHGATSSPSSSTSGLVAATQAEIYNSVTSGCSQVCTVPLSISKEMSKSQNVKSFMLAPQRQSFSSLLPAWESQSSC